MTLRNQYPGSDISHRANSTSSVSTWQACCQFNLTKCGLFPPGKPAVTWGLHSAVLCNVLCKVTLRGCLWASLPVEASSPLETQVPTHISHNHPKITHPGLCSAPLKWPSKELPLTGYKITKTWRPSRHEKDCIFKKNPCVSISELTILFQTGCWELAAGR